MKILLSIILTLYSIVVWSAPCVQTPLDTSTGVFPTRGFGYVKNVKLGSLPDWGEGSGTVTALHRSKARLFENGLEIGPAHSSHAEVEEIGGGRFSHWGNQTGTVESLRFSASNNSDPRSNGKAYTYCVGLDSPVTTTTLPPPPTTTTTTTLPLCSQICRSPATELTLPTTTTLPTQPEQ